LTKIIFQAISAPMGLITSAEAAKKLGVSVRRVQQLVGAGKIRAQQLGGVLVIEEVALADVKTYGKPGRPPKAQEVPKAASRRRARTAGKGAK
jgi:excisionase family DNA binding protein